MTIPILMIAPSIWMQKTFFQIAEWERGAKIGEASARKDLRVQLSIRVAALAHAVLQLAYAALVLLPVCIAADCTVVVYPFSVGFWTQEGKALERVMAAIKAAALGVFSPVIASASLIVDIQQLDDGTSFAVQDPLLKQGALLAFTLPPLFDIVKRAGDMQSLLRSLFRGVLGGVIAGLVHDTQANDSLLRDFFQAIEQDRFWWRMEFPSALAETVRADIAHYDVAFDITSNTFKAIAGEALDYVTESDSSSEREHVY